MDADVENMFRPFQEKDKGKQFRSFTDIPKISKIDLTEAWVDNAVSAVLSQEFFYQSCF